MRTRNRSERLDQDRRTIARCHGFLGVLASPLILAIALEKSSTFLESLGGWLVFSVAILLGAWGVYWGNHGLWSSGRLKKSSNHSWFDEPLDQASRSQP